MASETTFMDMYEEAIVGVAEQCDMLSLLELFKCGNRRLIQILAGPRGISFFKNESQFGELFPWPEKLLTQLKGLRILQLRTRFKTMVQNPVFLKSISKSLEELKVHTKNCLDIWYSPNPDPNLRRVPFDFASQFPNLTSLSIFGYTEDEYYEGAHEYDDYFYEDEDYECPYGLHDLSEECECGEDLYGIGYRELEENWLPGDEWISDHVPLLPSTLLHLKLGMKIYFPAISLLPTQLESLAVEVEDLEGVAWVYRFPDLRTLHLTCTDYKWKLSEVDCDDVASKNPTGISALSLTQLTIHHPLQKGFMCHFKNVDSLFLARVNIQLVSFGHLENLKTLQCGVPRADDPAVQIRSLPLFPPNVTNLHLNEGRFAPFEKWFARLPPNLRIFQLDQFLPEEMAALLPRTLTHLNMKFMEDDFGVAMKQLPKSLTYFCAPSYEEPMKPGVMAKISNFLPNLKVVETFNFLYKTPNTRLSLRAKKRGGVYTGWNSLEHALLKKDYSTILGYLNHESCFGFTLELVPLVAQGDKVPLDVLEWLRLRGLLSQPPFIGRVDIKHLFLEAIGSKNVDFLLWALPHCPSSKWSKVCDMTCLSHSRFIPVLDWLFENGARLCPDEWEEFAEEASSSRQEKLSQWIRKHRTIKSRK